MKRAIILYVIIFLLTMLIPLLSLTGQENTSELVTLFNGESSIVIISYPCR